MNDDAKLLLRYARDHSQTAFAELVRRQVDFVYSAALRRCNGDTHKAEDAVQQVFTALARNAEKLTSHPALSAWLYASTRNAVINLVVAEQRRAHREQEAVMSGLLSSEECEPDWSELRPVLDAVVDELSEPDRTAVLMRFFKKHSFAEIGAALNVPENTARMRTERALEKLRLLLGKRGVRSSAAALGLVLGRQAVVAAPAALAVAVTATILGISESSVVAVGASAGRSVARAVLTVGALVVATVLVVVGNYQARKPRVETADGTHTAAPAGLPEKQPRASAETAETTKPQAKVAQPASGVAAESKLVQASQPLAPSDPKAVEILQKMAAAYAALTSYQDWGEEVEKTLEGVEKGRVSFQTNFRGPDQFTFSWSQRISARTTWSGRIWWFGEQGGSYTNNFSTRLKMERPALVMITGVGYSWGSGFHVPLFFAGKEGRILFSLADLRSATLAGNVMFEDGTCYVIKGQHPNGTPFELWISQKDFLLRKIQTVVPLVYFKIHNTHSDPTRLLEEIHRGILINHTIADGVFAEAKSLAAQAGK